MTDLVNGLKDALEYTRLYREQTFVIKLGGEVLSSPEALDNVAVQVALLESLSIRVLVVHGGGPQASALSRRMGLEPKMVAGRRVTSPEVLQVAKMVYAGQINVDVVASLRRHGVAAVGLTGIDAGLVTVHRRPPVEITDDEGETSIVDFGEVGDVDAANTTLLDVLLPRGHVPVVASLAADPEGRILNVNADTLAAHLAGALGAHKLIYMTGAPGLLRTADDPSSLVAFAAPEDLQALLGSGSIKGGMRPKVEACLQAVKGGVRRTHIIDGRTPDALLLELFTGHGSGTMIVGEREKRDYESAGK
ncbi:MAG: acetylglutamate kinase [Thermoanaerobaculales bacterium]|jgi:acetylglutamate kinase|nr:acetylglutamate kinase [Thermoanaerobaculales bacterium]